MFLICLSTNIIILLLGAEVPDNSVCSVSYSPLCMSTPEGGTALLQDAQRHEPHQFQPMLANTCMCKVSFVMSSTVFLASLPLTGSSPSLKGHCSWCLAWFMLKPATWVLSGSLSSIKRTSASTKLTPSHDFTNRRKVPMPGTLCVLLTGKAGQRGSSNQRVC